MAVIEKKFRSLVNQLLTSMEMLNADERLTCSSDLYRSTQELLRQVLAFNFGGAVTDGIMDRIADCFPEIDSARAIDDTAAEIERELESDRHNKYVWHLMSIKELTEGEYCNLMDRPMERWESDPLYQQWAKEQANADALALANHFAK